MSDGQVQRDVEQADQLRSRLLRGDARLAAAGERVQTLSAQAAAALQQVRTSREQQAKATAQVLSQLRRLARLQQQVATGQDDLGRWARTSYAAGGPLASWQGWIAAFEGGATDDVGHDLAVMQHVGLVGSLALDQLQLATAAQRDAAGAAARAATAATTARRAADAARSTADALVRQQRVALVGLQAEQVRTELAVARLRQQLMSGSSADGLVAEARLAATVRIRSASSGRASAPLDPAGCRGLDTSLYDNGEIPAQALCPVWGAPGERLEAHAAEAFSALSRAFALRFGRPVCVTDSYRSRTAQVAVFAAKPGLAAVPGTSNHGWGTALDLCGGIESFASPEHAWLLANAPVHNWFHPSWAEPTGSRPEPWHWEFAG